MGAKTNDSKAIQWIGFGAVLVITAVIGSVAFF